MNDAILFILGGIGLFLIGMKTMTEALREAAGTRLRQFVSRFTTTPLRGVLSGTAVTALVQSSSATTVMTVGFVGAGLLSFQHALGVIYGANIGTTVTGWMIALLGVEMELGTLALPGIFLASLLTLVSDGRGARIGRAAGGFCLIFIGLDMMQEGAAGFDKVLTPDSLPSGGLAGLVQLMLLGLAMTVVMQSSSAAMAVALVFLAGGTILLEQAAAMVIGMNLGTTVTALLASAGGGRMMRRTAVANVVFNAVTALLAFPILFLGAAAFAGLAQRFGDATALVLFHSTFNLAGAALFVPATTVFARVVTRLMPDEGDRLTRTLDPALLSDEGAAMDAAQAAATAITDLVFGALGRALQAEASTDGLTRLCRRTDPALNELSDYVARIQVPEGKPQEAARLTAILHQIDHLRRLIRRAGREGLIPPLLDDDRLRRPVQFFAAVLRDGATPDRRARRLAWLSAHVASLARTHRRATLLSEHVGLITVSEMFKRTDALRWFSRNLHHAERIAHYACLGRHDAAP